MAIGERSVLGRRYEHEVRACVRRLELPGISSVVWHESGRGGIDGQPDLTLALPHLSVGIELKVWMHSRFQFIAVMRPQQVRFHAVMAQRGIRTLIMFMTDWDNLVRVMPGHYSPHKIRVKISDCEKYIRVYDKNDMRLLLDDISNGVFWHGWTKGSFGTERDIYGRYEGDAEYVEYNNRTHYQETDKHFYDILDRKRKLANSKGMAWKGDTDT